MVVSERWREIGRVYPDGPGRTQQDWIEIYQGAVPHNREFASRMLDLLVRLETIQGAFAVNQLVHCLQTATRAERSGASDELVLAALCHDVGKVIFDPNHGAIAAEMLKPFVSTDTYHLVLHHTDFEGRYYFGFFGANAEARLKHQGQPWFLDATRFADEWDQVSFDPKYDTCPLSHFEPLVQDLLAVPLLKS